MIKRSVFLCLVFLFLCKSVSAQQLGLSISPPLVETTIRPGTTMLLSYTVSNVGDPMIVSTYLRSFKPAGIHGEIRHSTDLESPIRFNLQNSNIKLENAFFLKSKEGQKLLLQVRVPEGTPEGDYYYTFFVQNETGKPSEGVSGVDIQGRVGAQLLITVTKTGVKESNGAIGTFSMDKHFFESTEPIPVKLILQNTGKNIVKPSGTIQLTGTFGDKATFTISPQNILAQSSRLATATTSDNISTLKLSGFYVGKYTLQARVLFPGATQPSMATLTFYAFPFKLALIGVAILVFGILALKQFKSRGASNQ